MNLFKGKKHFRILKSLSVKLDEESTFILTYMYYTDKMDKDKNQYRYEGLVVKNEDLEAKIRKMEAAPNLPWTWGYGIPDDFLISYHTDTNRAGSSLFKARLKKAMANWDEFLKKANENPVKRYPLKDYEAQSGEKVEIKNKEDILKFLGQSISHIRDRAEKTFDIYDPNRKFRRYNSNVKATLEKERAILEKRHIIKPKENGQQ